MHLPWDIAWLGVRTFAAEGNVSIKYVFGDLMEVVVAVENYLKKLVC